MVLLKFCVAQYYFTLFVFCEILSFLIKIIYTIIQTAAFTVCIAYHFRTEAEAGLGQADSDVALRGILNEMATPVC
jgi:hypothetical protein